MLTNQTTAANGWAAQAQCAPSAPRSPGSLPGIQAALDGVREATESAEALALCLRDYLLGEVPRPDDASSVKPSTGAFESIEDQLRGIRVTINETIETLTAIRGRLD